MKWTWNKKSRIQETPTLLTDADSRTDTNLKRKRLSFFFLSLPAAGKKKKKITGPEGQIGEKQMKS